MIVINRDGSETHLHCPDFHFSDLEFHFSSDWLDDEDPHP